MAATLLIVFVLGLLAGYWLGRTRVVPLPVPSAPPPPVPPPTPVPTTKIPDRFDETGLSATLQVRLSGSPADGTTLAAASAPLQKVIWVDQGDEVLVHLDSLRTRVVGQTLLVSLDLETDQTGRTALVVPMALASANDPAALVAVTDDLPRGNGLLASRWGRVVQDAVWAGMLGLASDHAAERGLAPRGIVLDAGSIRLHAGPVMASVEAAR